MNGAEIVEYLRLYRKLGISFFPLFPSTKIPVVKHNEYYQRQPTKEEIKEWLSTYLNPAWWAKVWEEKKPESIYNRWIDALRTEFSKIGRDLSDYKYEGEVNIAVAGGFNKLTLIDIEDASKVSIKYDELFQRDGFVVVATGKEHGRHLWCLSDWKENVKGKNGEIRVNNQYVVAPPSRHPNGKYYRFVGKFDKLEEVTEAYIREFVLKWIEAESAESEKAEREKKIRIAVLWDTLKDAVMQLPVVHGKRSDWLFALTIAAKTLLRDEKKAFEELMQIPICKSKMTRDGQWDEDKAYEWWKKFEWEDIETKSIVSLKHVIKWAEKVTGLSLPVDFGRVVDNYLLITREKGYGYTLSEYEVVLEIVDILDQCIVERERKGEVKLEVIPDYIHYIAEKLNNMFYFACVQEFDELRMYRNGVYVECEKWLKKLLQHAWNTSKIRVVKQLTTQKVNEIIDMIKRMNYTPLSEFYKYQKKYINVKNGLISIGDWKFRPHSPEIKFLTQVNAEYDPNVFAEEWEKFLDEVCGEQKVVLQEFCGYCLLPDCRFEKALAIVGPGGSGKSTFLEVIRNVLGEDSTTAFSLQNLENDRFACSEMIGKFANIYGDLPYDYLEKSDIFKQLVSGDPIQVEKKFKQPFLARLHVKLIFSANQLPATRDTTSAFFRRWIIVTFPNAVANPNPTMKIDLSSDDRVRNYVFKWMLEGLKRLLEQKKFSYNYSAEEIAEFYIAAADSVFAFVQEHIVEDPMGEIEKDELYRQYVEFCKARKYPPVSHVSFANKLRALVKVQDVRKQKAGVRKRYWTGIRYVEEKASTENEKEEKDFDLESLIG